MLCTTFFAYCTQQKAQGLNFVGRMEGAANDSISYDNFATQDIEGTVQEISHTLIL